MVLTDGGQRPTQFCAEVLPASTPDLYGLTPRLLTCPTGRQRGLKIRNRSYSQWVGREELFQRERDRDPDFQGWDACALVANVPKCYRALSGELDDQALPCMRQSLAERA